MTITHVAERVCVRGGGEGENNRVNRLGGGGGLTGPARDGCQGWKGLTARERAGAEGVRREAVAESGGRGGGGWRLCLFFS